MELQGDLCFATCELFMRKISKECRTLLLSMHRCTTMDDGALSLVIRLDDEFRKEGKTLLITNYHHLDLLSALSQKNARFLKFQDLDEALFDAETNLLDAHGYQQKVEPVRLIDQQLLHGLTQAEVDELTKHLLYKSYAAGETIIKKGSPAEDMFFIESGRVAIHDTLENNRNLTLAIIVSPAA